MTDRFRNSSMKLRSRAACGSSMGVWLSFRIELLLHADGQCRCRSKHHRNQCKEAQEHSAARHFPQARGFLRLRAGRGPSIEELSDTGLRWFPVTKAGAGHIVCGRTGRVDGASRPLAFQLPAITRPLGQTFPKSVTFSPIACNVIMSAAIFAMAVLMATGHGVQIPHSVLDPVRTNMCEEVFCWLRGEDIRH